jgi:hypothetical protein
LRILRIPGTASPFSSGGHPVSSGGHPATADPQAQVGQLSGDGQLRELIEERRGRHGGTGPIWYLQPAQLASLGLGQGEEAVVTPSPAVLT